MAKHIDTGKKGERMAIAWLNERAYSILEQNWRYGRWEVDVIAEKEMVLHFIEIKTRRTKLFGMPEQSVGKNKMNHLINAAEQYLYQNPQWQRIQFNILSILILQGQPAEYFLIEDVFL
jgi:putative endonuclease